MSQSKQNRDANPLGKCFPDEVRKFFLYLKNDRNFAFLKLRYSQPFCWPKAIINVARGNAPGTSHETNPFGQRP